jgi:hypothetical protein
MIYAGYKPKRCLFSIISGFLPLLRLGSAFQAAVRARSERQQFRSSFHRRKTQVTKS